MTLSELIINDPEPVNNIIRKIGKKPVYVPWFSGRMETEAAKALDADLFGAPETAKLKYNDKSAIPVMVVNACKRRFVYLPFRKHFMVLHASTRYITRKIKDERRYNFRQLG